MKFNLKEKRAKIRAFWLGSCAREGRRLQRGGDVTEVWGWCINTGLPSQVQRSLLLGVDRDLQGPGACVDTSRFDVPWRDHHGGWDGHMLNFVSIICVCLCTQTRLDMHICMGLQQGGFPCTCVFTQINSKCRLFVPARTGHKTPPWVSTHTREGSRGYPPDEQHTHIFQSLLLRNVYSHCLSLTLGTDQAQYSWGAASS